MRFTAKNRSIVLALVMLTASGTLWSQQATEIARGLVENYHELRSYSWNARTEVRVKGQQLSVTMEMMRYDLDGRLQATPMGGSGSLSEEMHQLVNALTEKGYAYAQPDPKRAEKFMQQASVWEGRRGNVGTMRAEGKGFLESEDHVDLRAENRRPDSLSVEASYRGSPLKIEATYRGLPNKGPNYLARLVVHLPSEGVDLIIENFDYQASGGIAAGDVSIMPKGAVLNVRLEQSLSSADNQDGQQFEATLDEDLVVQGKTAIRKGAKIAGEIVHVEGSGKASGRAKMALTLKSISIDGKVVPIKTNTLSFEAEDTHKKDRRRIFGGAGLGAIVGGIAGGGSGAAKGALLGGGVGTAATLLTKGQEVEFDVEHQFTFSLMKEVTVTPR